MSRKQRLIVSASALALPCLFAAQSLHAQDASPSGTATAIPHLVRVTGAFSPATGLPPSDLETVTLAIYAEETGGTPLWQETQDVAVDKSGRFTVLLGATQPDGIPAGVFASGEAQWLGMQFAGVAEVERPRTRITSVPYALRTSDADMLGGRPASEYLRAGTPAVRTAATTGETSPVAAETALNGSPNVLSKYVTASDLGPSAVYEAGGLVGIGTTTPGDALHVRFTNTFGGMTGVAVQNLGNTPTSYSGMLFYDQNGALGQFQGFNNVTHEYRINNIAPGGTINFMLGSSSKFKVRTNGDLEISGNLFKSGQPFLSSFGTGNTFLGEGAGNFTMTGTYNAATGAGALANNTTGFWNTASGYDALFTNGTGQYNTAFGAYGLYSNSTGSSNTANGTYALGHNNTGSQNTASGDSALFLNTEGWGNVAVGFHAGLNATTGSNNIYLGTLVTGSAGESNTMYLGLQGTQTKTIVAGIRGITTGLDDAVPVLIDSAGQLGTVSSSRRFKEEIRDMGDASGAIFALRPVTFRYAKAYANGAKPLQYGLVAEEVAEAFPALAVHNANGGVDTVHYETLSVLLLNEVQKQQRTLEQQRGEIEMQRAEIDLLKRRLAALEGRRQ